MRNVTSKAPMNAPTMTDRTMTTRVSLIVSALVGHVTFLSSAITSRRNWTGDVILGMAGLTTSINTRSQYYAYLKPQAFSLALSRGASTGLMVSKLANENLFAN